MRAAEELLAYLEGNGFHLWIDGPELAGEGPPELLTPELLESIRLHKIELLALLAEASNPPPATGKPPGPEAWRLSHGLSILGPEGFDFRGEDRDLARLARRDDDGWPRISKF